MENQKLPKIMDKQNVMGSLIRGLYFPKKNQFHLDIQRLLHYEFVLFFENDNDMPLIDKIRKDTQYASFDYKIYEEIKEIKKEIR
jgi:hypothetical protein